MFFERISLNSCPESTAAATRKAAASRSLARGPRNISWHYVRGHVGTPGNERVDRIADAYATSQPMPLYAGPLADYPVHDILRLPDDTAVPPRKNASPGGNSKAAAYAYLSVVDGTPMRHATWAECEARVKGRPGARFKKVRSEEEAAKLIKARGVTHIAMPPPP